MVLISLVNYSNIVIIIFKYNIDDRMGEEYATRSSNGQVWYNENGIPNA